MALRHGIVSRFTAFVAVDASVTETGERVEVVQPVELPYGWDPAFLQQGGSLPLFGTAVMSSIAYGATPPPSSPHGLGARLSSFVPRSLWSEPLSEIMPNLEDQSGVAEGPSPDYRGPAPASPSDAFERRIAQSQRADGSLLAGGVEETATGLAALVLLGHTRQRGKRSRVVAEAAAWLDSHGGEPAAALALELLTEAEAGNDLSELARAFGPRLSVVLPGWAAVEAVVAVGQRRT